MADNSKNVRVASLKKADDINKKNVAYFTLTDGSVAVVKKEGIGLSQNYNSQNTDFSKYKRNFGNNNNANSSDSQSKGYGYKGQIYSGKNYLETQNNDKKNVKIQKNENNFSSKGYYYKSHIYNKINSNKNDQNLNNSQEKEYSYKAQIYKNQNSEDSNKRQNNYSRKYQNQQNI